MSLAKRDKRGLLRASRLPPSIIIMSALFFSSFDVSRQAFYRSGLAAAIVNLKPIVPGR